MATINVPHLFTSLLAIAGEVFVFGRLCLLLLQQYGKTVVAIVMKLSD